MATVEQHSDTKLPQTKYLKDIVAKEYCTIDLQFDKFADAVKRAENFIISEEVMPEKNATEIFEQFLSKEEVDYKTHPLWYQIGKMEDDQNSVMEIGNASTELNNSQEYEKLDDSIMCSQKKNVPLDPLTKMAIKNICKNRKCGHLYDLETITLHVKRKKKVAHCPYVGCTNILILSDIIQEVGVGDSDNSE